MAASSWQSTDFEQMTKTPHSAIICGVTGSWKTALVLELLESHYQGVFSHIVILCPTVRYNKHIKNVLGSGMTMKSIFMTPVNSSMIIYEPSIQLFKEVQHYILLMIALQQRA